LLLLLLIMTDAVVAVWFTHDHIIAFQRFMETWSLFEEES
jgi:hypothetical protein